MSDHGKDLPPDQWQRVKEVFAAALERSQADRAAFLDEVCGTAQADIRREVEALIAAHQESDTFLETPASAMAAPPTPRPIGPAEGETLGPYRVLRILGRGGMATVYLARDLRHRRSVALKVLHPDLAHALGPERFLREIEVAANLSHPHILPLHDSGEVAGLLYYVMPYVEGESLRDRLNRETQLPVDEALQLAREVADGLAYAHGQGVVHRDIKPENILLSGGHALVADFGIARAIGQGGSARLTERGMAVGTAAYMSPEQASAASHIDGRSDIYSLGCVLYEMLAGEPPYTGPTAQAIIAKRFSDPVPAMRRVRPTVPERVDRAVTRALAPVPADRFATAAEFARALQPGHVGPTMGSTVPLVKRTTSRMRIALIAAVSVVTALALVWILSLSNRRGVSTLAQAGGASTPAQTANAPLARGESVARSDTTPRGPVTIVNPSSERPRPGPRVPPSSPADSSRPAARRTVSSPPSGARVLPTAPASGFLTINSDPFGTVFVDGVEIGDVPVVNLPLRPGRHVIELRREGFRTAADTVEVVAGNPIRLNKRLTRK
jgi:serine/threonine protein kinase